MPEPIPAEEFKSKDGRYRFPFTLKDDTPGGGNLGRIVWNIEIVRSENSSEIVKLLVWTGQTRDARYTGKIFEIHCHTEALSGHAISRSRLGAFTDYVWLVSFCGEHHGVILAAYPPDDSTVLVIDVASSISIVVGFE